MHDVENRKKDILSICVLLWLECWIACLVGSGKVLQLSQFCISIFHLVFVAKNLLVSISNWIETISIHLQDL